MPSPFKLTQDIFKLSDMLRIQLLKKKLKLGTR